MRRRTILVLTLLASLSLLLAGCFHAGHWRHDGRAACGKPCQGPCAKAHPCGGPCGPNARPGGPCATGPCGQVPPCGAAPAAAPCGGPAQAADMPRIFVCDQDPGCDTVAEKAGDCKCGKPMRELEIPPTMLQKMKERREKGMDTGMGMGMGMGMGTQPGAGAPEQPLATPTPEQAAPQQPPCEKHGK